MAAPAVLTNLGSLNAKPTISTTFTTAGIGTATVGSGSVIVVPCIRRNGSDTLTGLTVTDSAGNSYSTLAFGNLSGAAGNGQINGIYLCASPAAILTTTTFTVTAVNPSTITTLAQYNIHFFELDSTVADAAVGAAAGITVVGTAPAVTSGTPSSGDYLWLGAHGAANNNSVTDTISSTGYTLLPASTAMEGTTGGSATANSVGKYGYKQVTASAVSQTFNGTLGTAAVWGAVIAAVQSAGGAPVVRPRARRTVAARSGMPGWARVG